MSIDYAALAERAGQKQQERIDCGDRSVPGFPHAVSSGIAHEVYEPTDDELVRNQAAAEQITAALVDVDSHDLASELPIFSRHPDVRLLVNKVVELNRDAHSPGDGRFWSHELYNFSNEIVEWRAGRGGHWLPEHNPNNPDHAAKMFGIYAGEPGDLHVLAGEYTVQRWLDRRRVANVRCDWDRYAHLWSWAVQETISGGCDKRASGYLTLGQGQFLVAIATCDRCFHWLLRGGSSDA